MKLKLNIEKVMKMDQDEQIRCNSVGIRDYMLESVKFVKYKTNPI